MKRNNEARMLVAQGSPVNVEKAGVSGSISDKPTYQYRYEPTTVDNFSVSDNKEVKPALIRIGKWEFKSHSQLVDARLALGQKK